MIRKSWKIKSNKGDVFKFTPIFETKEDGPNVDVETTALIIENTKDGKEYQFNFMNIFQFIYFVCNEELRQSLAQRYQRRVNNIPYDVVFKLTDEEIKTRTATRRINLPVDEITMAIARNEAFKLMPKVNMDILKGVRPQDLFKGRRKQ